MAKSIAPPPPFFARVSNHFVPLVINSNSPASVNACQRRVAGCLTGRKVGSVLQEIASRLSTSSLGIARSEVNVTGSNISGLDLAPPRNHDLLLGSQFLNP